MTDYIEAGLNQQADARLAIENKAVDIYTAYGRNYGQVGVTIMKVKPRPIVKTPKADTDIFKRSIYLCPELKQTCHRIGAYDAFELPSIIGAERRPYRFSLASNKE